MDKRMNWAALIGIVSESKTRVIANKDNVVSLIYILAK